MTNKSKTSVQIRRRTNSTGGKIPRNLPDVHIDENVRRVPPLPENLKAYPNAQVIWTDICRILIRRGKLKWNHLPIVNQAVMYYSLSMCSNRELEELGYITMTDTGYKPPLHSVRKTITDAFVKCYSSLTLDPRNEIYDCMIENSGRAVIEVGTYDEF